MILRLLVFWKKNDQKKEKNYQAAAIGSLGDMRLRSNTGLYEFEED